MSKGREVRSYDYVNRPYGQVRDALQADPREVFRSATRAAADRARSVAAELRANIAGVDVAAEVVISVGEIRDVPAGPASGPVTRIQLEWEAARRPGLFPLMDGELSVYPLTATETQLDFAGRYEPPLGAVGGAIDAVVGHRIAEASVHRFLRDVAQYLRDTIAGS